MESLKIYTNIYLFIYTYISKSFLKIQEKVLES